MRIRWIAYDTRIVSPQNNPTALHLRAMNMLYEAIKERGSMVIVPSSAVETMGLGGVLATSSLAGVKAQ